MSFFKTRIICISLALSFVPGFCFAENNSENSQIVSEEESDQVNEVDIRAEKFSYSPDGDEITAEGNVIITSGTDKLETDKLVVNQAADKIYAIGNVVYTDKYNNVTKAERLELTGDFKRGIADYIEITLGGTTAVLNAKRAVKVNKEKVDLYGADYTSCVADEGSRVPWVLNAEKVSYNAEEESVIYRNAVLDLYDIPVFYTPIFYHSTNPDKPVSGFLFPSLESSTTNGFGIQTAYFWAMNDKNDMTFRATYLGKRGVILGVNHRYVGSNLVSDFKIEGLEDKEQDKHARGMLHGSAEYIAKPGRRAGVDLNLVSDNDYLDDFKEISDAYRSSTLYAEDASDSHYLGLSSRFFIDMRNDVKDDELGQPVLRLQMEKVIDTDDKGGQLQLNGDVLSLLRASGPNTNRFVAKAEYNKPFYSEDGSLFEFSSFLRGDYYDYDPDLPGESSRTEKRLLPEASVSWEKPYMSASTKHIISPKVIFVASPDKDFDDVPNEDSTSFELDATNLFDKNRFSGLDRVETGTRLIYGLDTKYIDLGKTKFHGFLGQSYNFSEKEEYVTSGVTSNNKNSDWVGFFNVEPNNNLIFGSSFRLDSASFANQRADSYITLGTESKYSFEGGRLERDSISLSHSFLKDDSEEVNVFGYYNVNERVALRGRIQHNIFEDITLKQEIETIYDGGCYDFSFKVRKTKTNDIDSEDSLDFLFNFSLKPSGK